MYSKFAARRYCGMRPLRHFVPGLPVHLVHRGHDRQRIFRRTGDFLLFHRYLGEAAAKFEVAVHAYVLMTNHVHLVLTPDKDEWGISRALQVAGRNYAVYFNRRYRRTGTIWESRFHCSTIESDRYLLACHRYLDLNPVRAHLVLRPEYYPWSSHRHYAGGRPDPLVTPHRLVDSLGYGGEGRERAYRRLFEAEPAVEELEQIRMGTRTGRAIGRRAIQPSRGRPKKIDSDTIFQVTPPGTAPRAVAMR